MNSLRQEPALPDADAREELLEKAAPERHDCQVSLSLWLDLLPYLLLILT